jgi:hypothetical protein
MLYFRLGLEFFVSRGWWVVLLSPVWGCRCVLLMGSRTRGYLQLSMMQHEKRNDISKTSKSLEFTSSLKETVNRMNPSSSAGCSHDFYTSLQLHISHVNYRPYLWLSI